MAIVFTIGHSTRGADELIELLREHDVRTLVDVRRFPGSRRNPQFGQDVLSAALAAARIEYVHEPDMGGYRKGREDTPNTAWRAKGFRAYADHMDSPQFQNALTRLVARAESDTPAIMCAEAVPWRCHRQLISDALTARGIEVRHILGPGRADRHELNPAARVRDDGGLVYREPAADQIGLFGEEHGGGE